MRQTYTSEKRLLPEGKGRGAVKLAPLRRRSRGEQSRISQASKAWGLRGLSLGSSRAEPTWCPRLSGLSSGGTDMRCSTYPFICGVQEYVESMARRPGNSIQQGSFTPHILGGLQHRKRGATYQFERKSASKNSIFEGIRPIFQSLMGLKYAE